ncbi:MAG: hypothetical protein KAW67_07545, partial [Candidatus Eisenbacteria sp.]|nr:hypothetical protein [Candidatus Eisenbacteria bacterium]
VTIARGTQVITSLLPGGPRSLSMSPVGQRRRSAGPATLLLFPDPLVAPSVSSEMLASPSA